MFNTYSSNQRLEMNVVSGTVAKNYKNSFFLRFHLKSRLAEKLLSDKPEYNGKPVVIIQMMVCGDMEVIAEVMCKIDFDKSEIIEADKEEDNV